MPSTPNVLTQMMVRHVDHNQELSARSISRLSSGLRHVSASDDPAAMGNAEKFIAQNKRLNSASINVQNATSFIQSADSFMDGMSRILTRMGELSLYARDTTKNAADIALYQEEFVQLQQQLRNTIGGSTAEIGGQYPITRPLGSFNGNQIFAANPTGMTIATGANTGQNLTIPELNLRDGAVRDIIFQDTAGAFNLSITSPNIIAQLNSAIDDLANERGTVGAIASRLQTAASIIEADRTQLGNALSKIQDANIAEESTRLTKQQMLAQTGSAMLVQSMQTPRSVLQLIR